MLNKIILQGRCGSDPELRKTQNGADVATVNLAVDRDFKDKSTGKAATDWIPVIAWNSTAIFLSKYFSKGRMAVVEGRLQIRNWQDKNGNNRRSAEVIANSVYFGDSKRDADSQGGFKPAGRGVDVTPSDGHSDFDEIEENESELPF